MNDDDVLAQFQVRLTEFQDAYLWEEPDSVLQAFSLVGEMVDLAFDRRTAARAMTALRHLFSVGPDRPVEWTAVSNSDDVDWRDEWSELVAFEDTYWPSLMEGLHNLHAFAYYGILPQWDNDAVAAEVSEFADAPAYVRQIIAKVSRFASLVPQHIGSIGMETVERTCLAAEGRLKIDLGEHLSVHELAAVTQVTTKRLQNAIYAKSADAPLVDKDGGIPVESARRWLEARDYLPSLWREMAQREAPILKTALPAEAYDNLEASDFVFVPEAKDGTLFSPKLCNRRPTGDEARYTIGATGEEVDFQNFDEALFALTKMTTPRWRRPNDNGHFGVVSAERWRRLTRKELSAI